MQKFMTLAATTLALTVPALAQVSLDSDGDGNVSLAEIQAVYPDVTETTFTTMDTDGDGVLSEAELAAAVDAGMLPS